MNGSRRTSELTGLAEHRKGEGGEEGGEGTYRHTGKERDT